METLTRIQLKDSVIGDWCVDKREFAVWMDGSSFATGVAPEANRSVVESVSWLRPANNAQHINLVDLDEILKRVNLVLQWQAKVLHIWTDMLL